MKKQLFIHILITTLLANTIIFAQNKYLYKQVDTTKLYMEVYSPLNIDSTINYPAIIFFFGGAWRGGSSHQFINHAQYFSKRGLVCFLVDYRTEKKNHTTPFECLKDAKSAMRFVRKNASKFNVDKEKLIASGGSAGGQLAAATALIENYNEETDDSSISCIPNALVLFNPVIDNGPGGYGFERIGDQYKNFSPLHNIKKGAPPTILFFGTKDKYVPVVTAEYYKMVMEKVGSRCDLFLYKDQPHAFFNYKYFYYYKKTVIEADKFLQSLGYLNEEPIIVIE